MFQIVDIYTPENSRFEAKNWWFGSIFFRRGGHVQVPRQFWGSRLGPFAQISLNQLNKSLFIRPRDDLGCLSSHHEDSQIVSKEFLETFICHYNH